MERNSSEKLKRKNAKNKEDDQQRQIEFQISVC